MTFSDREPAITAGSIVTLASAVIGVVALFIVPISAEQKAGLLALAAAVAPFVVGLLIRDHVTPEAKIDQVPIARAALDEAETLRKETERLAKQA